MRLRFIRHHLPVVLVGASLLLWCIQWWCHADLSHRILEVKQRENHVISLENQVTQLRESEVGLKALLKRIEELDMGPKSRNSFEESVSVLASQWGLVKPPAATWPSRPSDSLTITRQGDFVDLCHWLREVSIQCPLGTLQSLEIFEMAESPGAVLCRATFSDQNLGGPQ